jgi:DNA-binding NarL/FixJ family response regulator
MGRSISVIYYDDNNSLRQSISLLLQATDGIELVAAFSNADTVKNDVTELKPDVILMDIDMPGVNGIEAARIVRSVSPATQVIMLTVFDDEEKIFDALRNGASGYLLKNSSPSDIINAIKDVHTGGSPMTANIARKVLQYFQNHPKAEHPDYKLTAREMDILKELLNGNSYKMIAASLNISLDTVRSHIRSIYEKLHVNSKSEAIIKAINEKLV